MHLSFKSGCAVALLHLLVRSRSTLSSLQASIGVDEIDLHIYQLCNGSVFSEYTDCKTVY